MRMPSTFSKYLEWFCFLTSFSQTFFALLVHLHSDSVCVQHSPHSRMDCQTHYCSDVLCIMQQLFLQVIMCPDCHQTFVSTGGDLVGVIAGAFIFFADDWPMTAYWFFWRACRNFVVAWHLQNLLSMCITMQFAEMSCLHCWAVRCQSA